MQLDPMKGEDDEEGDAVMDGSGSFRDPVPDYHRVMPQANVEHWLGGSTAMDRIDGMAVDNPLSGRAPGDGMEVEADADDPISSPVIGDTLGPPTPEEPITQESIEALAEKMRVGPETSLSNQHSPEVIVYNADGNCTMRKREDDKESPWNYFVNHPYASQTPFEHTKLKIEKDAQWGWPSIHSGVSVSPVPVSPLYIYLCPGREGAFAPVVCGNAQQMQLKTLAMCFMGNDMAANGGTFDANAQHRFSRAVAAMKWESNRTWKLLSRIMPMYMDYPTVAQLAFPEPPPAPEQPTYAQSTGSLAMGNLIFGAPHTPPLSEPGVPPAKGWCGEPLFGSGVKLPVYPRGVKLPPFPVLDPTAHPDVTIFAKDWVEYSYTVTIRRCWAIERFIMTYLNWPEEVMGHFMTPSATLRECNRAVSKMKHDEVEKLKLTIYQQQLASMSALANHCRSERTWPMRYPQRQDGTYDDWTTTVVKGVVFEMWQFIRIMLSAKGRPDLDVQPPTSY